MRGNAVLSSLLFLASTGIAVGAQASTITQINNPITYTQLISGKEYRASNYSKCADMSDARNWNSVFWCPKGVGSLTAAQVAALNKQPTPAPGAGGGNATQPSQPSQPAPGANGVAIEYRANPTTYTQLISGQEYRASDYSKCADMSDARDWRNVFWCPKSVGSLTADQVAALNKQPTPAPGAGGGNATQPSQPSQPAPGANGVAIEYRANPTTYTQLISGQEYRASDYSKCADMSDARDWRNVFWCPKGVGSLTEAQVAALNSGSGSKPVNPPSGGGSTTPPAGATYTAKLNWTAPSTREDGTPLKMSELTGYEIYYTSDDLKTSVTLPISNASATSHSVPNLKAGTYHFAISAIDSKGLKSKLSPMVSTKVGS